MPDKIYANLSGIRREMLKILGEVSSLTKSPLAIEDAIDDFWHPKCDVYQTETQWVVLVELAGVNKDEINISASSEYLRVSGTRVLHSEDCQTTYYSMEIDTATDRKCRVDAPRIDADRLGEVVGYFVVSGEMVGFSAHRPAGMDRRQHDLLMQALQNGRDAGRQIVVEQDGACLLYTSTSPRDRTRSRMTSSA